jgi:hypothetical protein
MYNYTIHCSDWLNLMTAEELPLQKSIFEASIDFAAEVGAEILVYHSGKVEMGNEYLGSVAFLCRIEFSLRTASEESRRP